MIRIFKKVLLSSVSVLGVSVLVWIMITLNPSWVYAHSTQVDIVTIYHDQELEEGTEEIVLSAIEIIRKSDLFDDNIALDLCLNDGSIYPRLNPLVGKPLAYATLDKTVLYNCTPNFKENIAQSEWAVNNYELRKFKLSYLIAHEFTHNLQNRRDFNYVFSSTMGTINWKLEGHADYVSRQYKNDGNLESKIKVLKAQEEIDHNGLPVFALEDGTKQILSYYKYSIIVQYMIEKEGLTYTLLCEDKRSLDDLYIEVIKWQESRVK